MIRPATLADLTYIEYLRRRESEAIGFIPIQRYEMEIDGRRKGDVLVYEENGDLVGFLYATHNTAGVTHIQQIAIQEDARRMERGKALVEAAIRRKDWLVSLRIADDLEATRFWEALGFNRIGHVNPKSVYGRGKDKSTAPTRRKRAITQWQKTVGGLWLAMPSEVDPIRVERLAQ